MPPLAHQPPSLIQSVHNPWVKQWQRLAQSKGRKEQGLALLEGWKLIEEAIKANLPLQALLIDEADCPPEGFTLPPQLPVIDVSTMVLKKLATTESPPPAMALLQLPSFSNREDKLPTPNANNDALLVLDGLQDAGNVGTLLRLAVAFGVPRVLVIGGGVDLWHPKVLRSHTGIGFHCDCFTAPTQQNTLAVLEFLQTLGWQVQLATGEGGRPYTQTQWGKEPTALVLGQEGQGLRLSLGEQARFSTLCVPMEPLAESLNVAACGAILLAHRYSQQTPAHEVASHDA